LLHGCVCRCVVAVVACFPKERVFPNSNSNPLWDGSQRVWVWVGFVSSMPRQKMFQVRSASVSDKTSCFDGGELADRSN
jgi:hypothetical protein